MKIPGSNPMNDPSWVESKSVGNQEPGLDTGKTLDDLAQALTQTRDTLNQNVRKGDMQAAKQRVDDLQKQFESFSPELKDFMYQTLTGKTELAQKFDYKLSTASREKLLKTLNPDHRDSEYRRKMESDKANFERAREKDFEGMLQQASLQKLLDSAYGGNERVHDPGFIPKSGSGDFTGDPGFTPKVTGEDRGLGDPGFIPRFDAGEPIVPQLPDIDPGFTPRVTGDDRGLGDPGFTPKLTPREPDVPQLPDIDPGFTPKVTGDDRGLGDPGFTPKVSGDDKGPGDPGFIPRFDSGEPIVPQLPNIDPGFTPKVTGDDKGLGDPGFAPKFTPREPVVPQLPNIDPGFTPKVNGDDRGLGDPGFTPKVSGDDKGLGDPGFTPKIVDDRKIP